MDTPHSPQNPCPSCGALVDAGASNCAQCGARARAITGKMFDAASTPPAGATASATAANLDAHHPTGSYTEDDFARASTPAVTASGSQLDATPTNLPNPVLLSGTPTPVDVPQKLSSSGSNEAPAGNGWADSTDGRSLENALDAAFSDPIGEVAADADRFAPGESVLDQYRVVRQLGQGGMGAVYLARDDVSGQEVAIKVLPAELAKDKDLRERFNQEARALAALDHPNIVPLLTFATRGEDRYLVMKFVPGKSVDDLLVENKKLDVDTAVKIFRSVVEALGYGHSQGVIHRDVKPGNVLLSDEGKIFLVDFGIAKQEQGASITQTGILMGTPQYMSPEQISGQVIDGRSDLYAAGLLLFEMLAGVAPFTGEKTFAILRAHVESKPPDVRAFRDETLPDLVVGLIDALLEKNPADRPQTADDVLAFLDGQTPFTPSELRPHVAADRVKEDEELTTPITAAIEQPFFNTARVDALVPPKREPMAAVLMVAAVIAVLVGGYFLAGWLQKSTTTPAANALTVDAGPTLSHADAAHERIVAKGNKELAEGNSTNAISLAETVLGEDHDDIGAQELLVSALIAKGQIKKAKAALVNLQVLATGAPDFDAKIDEKKVALQKLVDAASSRASARERARNARPDGLDNRAAQRILASSKNQAQLELCWERIVLSRNPKATAKVAMAVTVTGKGIVAKAEIKKATIADKRFLGCLKKAITKLRFPEFKGSPVIVDYRTRFSVKDRK